MRGFEVCFNIQVSFASQIRNKFQHGESFAFDLDL